MGEVGGEEPMKSDEKILVLVRVRPLSKKEIENNEDLDCKCIDEKTIMFRNNLQETIHTFDRVFSGDCSTRQVYEEGTRAIALSVVSGINSSILAYGQTSSGKTYTMSGITEYAVAEIYDHIIKHEKRAFVIKFSAMEIYNEAVGDLLSTDNTSLKVRDDPEKGAFVENLTEEILRDWGHFKELLSICKAQRRIGETSLNEASSRSHQIVRLTVESSSPEFLGKENSPALSASLNFVDLAGSESQASSGGERLKEGCHINSSLFTLGNVIRKLSKGKQGHVNYRDSKLTRILQPCLGGNARTVIICTLSPARAHLEQSRNTLFFASCAKEVSTNAKVNVVMSDKALLKRLQSEVARLETELRVPAPSFTCDCSEVIRDKDRRIQKLEMKVRELAEQRDIAESRVEELQLIIKNYQTSNEPAERDDDSPQWQDQFDDSDESSKDDTLSTGNNEANSKMMVFSYGNEAFESSSPCREEEEVTISKSRNQILFEQWDLSESRVEDSPIQVQDDQSSNNMGESRNSQEWPDQSTEIQGVEMDESSEDEISPLTMNNFSNEAFESSSPDEHESINSKFRKQWDLAQSQGEKDIYENGSSEDEVPKSVAISTDDDEETTTTSTVHSHENEASFKSPYPTIKETPFSKLRNQTLTRSSRFRSSKGLTNDMPNLSSEISTERRNPRLPPRLPTELSFSSLGSAYLDEAKNESTPKEDIPTVQNFVAGLKEMAKLEHEKNIADSQGPIQKTEIVETQISNWPLVFVRLQKAILELWQICNISLVHRTYFFLLFKGERTDSIYMEIELRRLSFLNKAFSKGNHAMDGDQILTLESSVEALRRERDMLIRLMHKKFSRSERNKLYQKLAINLSSKFRKRQFVNLLWSDTEDLDHVIESAEIVGKLIGFSAQGASLKEMFGLSFGFSGVSRSKRSFSWN